MEPLPLRERPPVNYFITTPTWRNRRIFDNPVNARLFVETLEHQRRAGFYRLHAFALLPDHMHLLISPIDVTLERAITAIKGGIAHRLALRLPVWGRSFAHPMEDPIIFEYHRDFIHHKPVRAGLCKLPEDYPFSSAHPSFTAPPPDLVIPPEQIPHGSSSAPQHYPIL